MAALRALDAVAVAIALPTLAKDFAHAAGRRTRVGDTAAGALFRFLDFRTAHLLTPASWLAVDYLLARAALAALRSRLSAPARAALALLSAVVTPLAVVYPLLWIYNVLGMLAWRNPPIHIDKRAHFPRSALFEDPATWKALRKELDAVLREDPPDRRFLDLFGNVTFVEEGPTGRTGEGNGWRTLFLRMGGKDVKANRERLPALAALLDGMPEVYNAFFSILMPGTSLAPHRGYFKGFLRYHLGMVVPEPDLATLIVGGKRYHWREGEGVLFDDMYIHAVENRCTKPRIVLFLDVVRPLGTVGAAATKTMGWIVDNHPLHARIRDKL
ncbi:Aspartyl/Asparaginyl beta-hydroxylase-domain-containing protein [Hyaloraphidium curvatum]|nr:Aspartyl/Asparaginyl beta-hydroxylase-domain-containing protein [Hyaloraphidium curvatum]